MKIDNVRITRIASSELKHHGILGQKWYVRRFQNPDGSLTAAGKKRYASGKMSDEELASVTDRLRRENALNSEYDRLHPPKKNPVKEFAKEFTKNTVKAVAARATDKIAKKLFPDDKKMDKTISELRSMDIGDLTVNELQSLANAKDAEEKLNSDRNPLLDVTLEKLFNDIMPNVSYKDIKDLGGAENVKKMRSIFDNEKDKEDDTK